MKEICKRILAIITLLTMITYFFPTISMVAYAMENEDEENGTTETVEENKNENDENNAIDNDKVDIELHETKTGEYPEEEKGKVHLDYEEIQSRNSQENINKEEEKTKSDFSVLAVPAGTKTGDPAEEEVEITDPAVTDFLNRHNVYGDENNKFQTAEISSITESYINLHYWEYENKTVDLTGLNYIYTLDYLDINNFEGSVDFSVLSTLPNLSSVYVGGNMENVSSLKTLPHLKNLYIDKSDANSTTDFSFLEDMNYLDELRLSVDTDRITSIGNLTNLKRLYVASNINGNIPYEDIDKLINLESLEIGDYNNRSFDISLFSNLTELKELRIQTWEFDTSKLNYFSHYTKLERLSLPQLSCQDLSFLLSLEHLNELSISINNTNQLDIDTISNLNNLTILRIANFSTDIAWIGELTNLRELELNSYYGSWTELDQTFFDTLYSFDFLEKIRLNWYFVASLGELENNQTYEYRFEDIPIINEFTRDDSIIFEKPENLTDTIYIDENENNGCVQIDYDNRKIIVTPEDGKPKNQVLTLNEKYSSGYEVNLVWSNPGDNQAVELDPIIINSINYMNIDRNNDGVYTVAELQQADVEYLYLSCNNQEVNLDGLEHITSLREITFSNARGRLDFTRLEDLNNLEAIHIYGNISEVIGIGRLKQISKLELEPYSNNNINLDFISELDSLEELHVQNCDLNDMSDKDWPENLRFVEIRSWSNTIDCSSLSSLNNVEILDISGNDIKNIDALKNLDSLKELHISSEKTDLSDINQLTNVERLYVDSDLKETDIDALKQLTGLKELSVSFFNYNTVQDYNMSFNEFTQLERLNITNYSDGITVDLNGLENNENLNYLRVLFTGENVTNLNKVAQIPNLETLQIEQNYYNNNNDENILDLTSLVNPNLKEIYVSGFINDIEPLTQLNNLETVTILNGHSAENINKYLTDLENIKATKLIKVRENFEENLGSIMCGESRYYDLRSIPIVNKINDINSPLYSTDLCNIMIENYYPSNLDKSSVEQDGYDVNITANEFGNQCLGMEIRRGEQYDYGNYNGNELKYIFDINIRINWTNSIEVEKTPINIPDENLRNVILEVYDIDDDKEITLNDLMNLEVLDITSKNVSSLEGIQNAANLSQIRATDNNISSLEYIKNLNNLTYFDLSCNNITDISDLTEMENIDYGVLCNNYIEDISMFKDKEYLLDNLSLYSNYIDVYEENNREVFNNCNKYTKSLLRRSQKYGSVAERDEVVTFPESVKNKLLELGVETNDSGNFTKGILNDFNSEPFDGAYYNECNLFLSDMNLTSSDIENLKYLNFITGLDLSNNKITDVSVLSRISGLQGVRLAHNNVNVETLNNVLLVPYFDLSDNNLTDISFLSNMESYTMYSMYGGYEGKYIELDLSDNKITDITPINDIGLLRELRIRNNNIEDITPLIDYNFGSDNYDDDDFYFDGDPVILDFEYNYIKGDNQETRDVIDLFNEHNARIDITNQHIDLIDENTNVEVSTFGDGDIRIQVTEIDNDADKAEVVVEQIGSSELLYSVDVSIIGGEYSGDITLRIPIDESLNGKKVKVIHLKDDGTVEIFDKKVEDGYVVVVVSELSPFYVTYNSEDQYLKGDVNGDGKVSLVDYGLVLAHVKRTKLLTGDQLDRADVNEDGKVSLVDYGLILAHVKRTKLLF